jgi:hypothetical protein
MQKQALLLEELHQFYNVEDAIKIKHDLNEIMYFFATTPPEIRKPTNDEIRSLRQTIVFLDKIQELYSMKDAPE